MIDAVSGKIEVIAYGTGQRSQEQRAARFYLLLAWIYPLLPLLALYATWLAGWAMLGHRPRPSLDDPKDIGGAVDAFYLVAALLLFTFPIGCAVVAAMGIPVTIWYVRSRTESWRRAVLLALVLAGIYAACLLLLKWDPLQVLYWYMD
jgi:hypothetical protein